MILRVNDKTIVQTGLMTIEQTDQWSVAVTVPHQADNVRMIFTFDELEHLLFDGRKVQAAKAKR